MQPPAAHPTLAEATGVWLRIGLASFGGPVGQIALIHREVVERRGWIDEARFMHALNYCMLLPGPEAQQLATYVGWLLHGTRGGVIAGVLFVLPGALALMAISALYVLYADLPLSAAVFTGVKAAVLAIVIQAFVRIARRVLTNHAAVAISAAAFLAIFVFDVPFPFIIAAAAAVGALTARLRPASSSPTVPTAAARVRPSLRRTVVLTGICLALWFAPVALAFVLLGSEHVLAREGVFFSQTAVVTFGGAYAVLAYVAQRAVDDLGWLTPAEMIDGLALAETTPGPLILVLQFVAFLAAYRHAAPLDPWLAALAGASLTLWVLFVPSFLFVLAGAPHVEALRGRRILDAALAGITAAVVGVILNLSIWFAVHTVFGEVRVLQAYGADLELPVWRSVNPVALGITVASLIAALRFKVGIGWLLAGSALAGALL